MAPHSPKLEWYKSNVDLLDLEATPEDGFGDGVEGPFEFLDNVQNKRKSQHVSPLQNTATKRVHFDDGLSHFVDPRGSIFTTNGVTYDPNTNYYSQSVPSPEMNSPITHKPHEKDSVDLTGNDDQNVVDLTTDKHELEMNSFQPTQVVCIGRISSIARVRKLPVFANTIHQKTPIIKVSIRQNPGDEFIYEIIQGSNVIGELSVSLSRVLAQIVKKITHMAVGKNWHLDKLEVKLQSKTGINGSNKNLTKTIKWPIEVHLHFPAAVADYAIQKFKDALEADLLPPTIVRYSVFQQAHKAVIEEETASQANPGVKIPSLAEQTRSVSKFLANHTSSNDLSVAESPSGLRTTLMRHQKQALQFMHEKEREINSLWAYRDGEWHHDLTGYTLNRAPNPGLGGIIADDMGLGKTLSIIGLILSTRAQAREFGNNLTVSDAMGATLVIVPKSLLDAGWSSQIAQHCEDDALVVLKWFGPGRTNKATEFQKADVVLTTYGQVCSDSRSQNSVLRRFTWFRIVLDEAHTIRNPEASAFLVCSKLEAQHRWAITGTPIQNSLNDFGSLLRFLRIPPFRPPKVFTECVKQWTADFGQNSDTLKTLVDSITIRRTKHQLYQGKSFPDKSNELADVQLDPRERDMYKFLEEELRAKLATAKELKKNRAIRIAGEMGNYLKHLTKIRLFLAHKEELMKQEDLAQFHGLRYCPIVIEDTKAIETLGMNEEKAITLYERLIDETENNCEMCSDPIEMPDEPEEDDERRSEDDSVNDYYDVMIGGVTPCAFALCPKCAAKYSEEHFDSVLPHEFECDLCDETHMSDESLVFELLSGTITERRRRQEEMRRSHLATVAERYSGPSAKVRFLLEKLKSFKEVDVPGEMPNKAVVFTAWAMNLDCIEIAMQKNGFKYVRIDGRMGSVQRRIAIEAFERDPEVTVFLATIGTGGVGINLVAGNHVFIMEPQWNPQAEEQAIDRVHRIGQTRPVKVYRLNTVDSFERQIREVAKAKLKLANGTLHRNNLASNWQRRMLEARFKRQDNIRALDSGNKEAIDLS